MGRKGYGTESPFALPLFLNLKPGENVKIWLVRDGEPLPFPSQDQRLLRMGRLAQMLAAQGHSVTWWTSTFDHRRKAFHTQGDHVEKLSPNLTLHLINAGSYSTNLSWQRLKHHGRLGRELSKRMTQDVTKPDLIMASFPQIETAYTSVHFGLKHHIPVVVDVRDFWPDSFEDYVPPWGRPFVRLVTRELQRKTSFVFKHATQLTASSKCMLTWASKKGQRPYNEEGLFYHGAVTSSPSPTIQHPVNASKTHFLYLGTLGKAHDFNTLAAAIQHCEAHIPQAMFTFAGTGPEEEKLKKALTNCENVTFKGWVDQDEAAALLNTADVCLCPFLFHAMSNKLTEALAHGKPILVSGPLESEQNDLIKTHGCGLYYPPQDIETLINHIRTMCDPEHLAPLTQAAQQVHSLFDANLITQNFIRLLEHVAQQSTPLVETAKTL